MFSQWEKKSQLNLLSVLYMTSNTIRCLPNRECNKCIVRNALLHTKFRDVHGWLAFCICVLYTTPWNSIQMIHPHIIAIYSVINSALLNTFSFLTKLLFFLYRFMATLSCFSDIKKYFQFLKKLSWLYELGLLLSITVITYSAERIWSIYWIYLTCFTVFFASI